MHRIINSFSIAKKTLIGVSIITALSLQLFAVPLAGAATLTFGRTTVGSSTSSGDRNRLSGSRFTVGSQGGNLSSMTVYIAGTGIAPNNKFQMFVYSDNNGVPGTRLASTVVGNAVANSWNTLPISYSVSPNGRYWLMYNANGTSNSQNNMRYSSGGTGIRSGAVTFGLNPTSVTWSKNSRSNSIYATYNTVTATPPTVALTTPVGGTVSGTSLPIRATATDIFGVTGVQFKINNQNFGNIDTVAPYETVWNTFLNPNGDYTISATAQNASGLTSTSSVVVTVNNPTPTAPVVTITSPLDGSDVNGSNQSISASVNDDFGILGVQFMVDGVNLGAEDTTAPYSTPWNTYATPNGSHTVSAKARNIVGLNTTSNANVTVTNGPPPITGLWESVSVGTPPVNFALETIDGTDAYGSHTIVAAPSSPNVVYVGSSFQGVWKTTDSGLTWNMVQDIANTNSCGDQNRLSWGKNWALAVDPTDHNTVYTVSGISCSGGLYKSTDGGQTWNDMMPLSLKQQTTNDIYSISINPNDRNHILLGSHSLWNGKDAGVLESRDGGVTWITHPAKGSWGAGHYVHFLDNADCWLLMTQGNGYWKTTDAGVTWTKVTNLNMTHGAGMVYKSQVTGNWYATTEWSIIRSVDGGSSWTAIHNSPCSDGYYSIIGDGYRMYTSHAFTGGSACGTSYVESALETDDTNWSAYNNQTFSNGANWMSFDPVNRIVWSSNWFAGVWKLRL
ncbi:hypothetical protein KBB49_01805 [Candidatus Saccharibacteria bacterium]|nr:hypothetical protein [Candidatus Saccharibacteria bacterium]